jgi:uncharacterized repeat protein (TIGR01451 family)
MFKQSLTKISAIFLLGFLILGLVSFLPNAQLTAQAATEPDCDQPSNTAAFNPYPITKSNPNPIVDSYDCKDMPMLSFFPIDTRANNPREITVTKNQNVTFQAYYNNGANAKTGQSIMNPTIGIDVKQVNNTRFCISSMLKGSGAAMLTSAAQGGDLCLNAPEGSRLEIVGNSVKHFPDAIERQEKATTTGQSPSDSIADNSAGTTISNPIYKSFPNTNLVSTSGHQLKEKLEPGFLNYGYVLAQFLVVTPTPTQNQPPQVPGQEITIVRGDSGSFNPYSGTDPNQDYPLTYVTTDLPAFCSLNQTTYVVNCKSDEKTPVRSEFNVTPTDSKGLAGTPGKFIVNIIESDKAILATSTKTCVRIQTNDKCETAKLKPSEKVTYTINVTNTGKADATGVVVVDNYDQELLKDITPKAIEGINITDVDGFLNFKVGTIAPGKTVSLTYDATIKEDVKNGVIVVNTADISADNLPKHTVSTKFPVILPNNPLLEAVKNCVKTGTSTPCKDAKLQPGAEVTYSISVKNIGDTTAYNVSVIDDLDQNSLDNLKNITPDPREISKPLDKVTWGLGNLDANQGKTITYTATIKSNVTTGTKIYNKAVIKADNLEDITVDYDFPVVIPVTVTERSGGTAITLLVIVLATASGAYYYYYKNGKIGKNFLPKRSTKE